jgi:hypothetical protein
MKTLDELQAEFAQLADVVATANARRQIIHAEIVQRKRQIAAQLTLRKLSDDEKDSLREALRTEP